MAKIKAFPIRTATKRETLKVIVELLNFSIGLKGREKDVFAELLFWSYIYKDYTSEVKNKMVFDYDRRIAISDHLGISREALDNNFTSLRKKGLIIGRTINPKYDFTRLLDDNVLAFKFIENAQQNKVTSE